MDVQIEKNELVIRIPLSRPTPSASGKTMVVASTRGNQPTTATIDGKPLVVSVNAYFKP